MFVFLKKERHRGTWTKKITITFWKLERRMSGNCDPADQKLYLKQPKEKGETQHSLPAEPPGSSGIGESKIPYKGG